MGSKPYGSLAGIFFCFAWGFVVCLSFKCSTDANLCETYRNKFANIETEFYFSSQATQDAMFTAPYLKQSGKENIP